MPTPPPPDRTHTGASCPIAWEGPPEEERGLIPDPRSYYGSLPRAQWRPSPDEERCVRPVLVAGASRVLEEAGPLWWPATGTGELLFRAVGMGGFDLLCRPGPVTRLVEERLGAPADIWQ